MELVNEMKIKTYAPVVIPTLCRYDHFKTCVESLSKCKWADRTDVFIGLDYPAKESHWDGYVKIRDYLYANKERLGFKSLTVIERDHNYGLGPHGNIRQLKNHVLEHFDRLIFSEDDNVFSPNFLVFMNKGLELFKNDESVLALNGYRHFYQVKKETNTFFRQNVDFSAWGYGIWKDRQNTIYSLCDEYFKKHFSLRSMWRLRLENGNNRALNFANYALRAPASMSDSPLSVYAWLEGKDIIMPASVSLVRNVGWDDSGEHSLNNDTLKKIHMNQPISDDFEFDFVGNGFECYEANKKIFRNNSYAKISNFTFFRSLLKLLFKYLMGKK